MTPLQAMVEDLMRKHGQETPERPRLQSAEVHALRRQLIQEELDEYTAACKEGDLVEVYDGLLDLLYVVLGSFVAHGMDAEPGFAEVHRSNMTKDGAKDAGGKITKGANYSPPRLARILSHMVHE